MGEGGHSEVWAVRSPSGRAVAVKVLTEAGAEREDLRLRLRAEGDLLRRLGGSRNLIRCEEVWDEPPGLVLELLDPTSLRDRLEAGPLPISAAVTLGIEIAAALAWLHRHGVIHRDVKPSNILFSPEGVGRLLDLGVAAQGDPPRGLPAGWIEEEVGTLGYAAPEQLRDPTVATPAADVYGLGATLYHAVSGRLPLPPGPLEIAGSAPALARVIHNALAADPAARYPSIEAFAAALSRTQ